LSNTSLFAGISAGLLVMYLTSVLIWKFYLEKLPSFCQIFYP
jgi:hypothetical protein